MGENSRPTLCADMRAHLRHVGLGAQVVGQGPASFGEANVEAFGELIVHAPRTEQLCARLRVTTLDRARPPSGLIEESSSLVGSNDVSLLCRESAGGWSIRWPRLLRELQRGNFIRSSFLWEAPLPAVRFSSMFRLQHKTKGNY